MESNNQYYTKFEVIEKIKYYQKLYPEIRRRNICKVSGALKELIDLDSKFPPYELWDEIYSFDMLSDYINVRAIRKEKIKRSIPII
jgi:hypothetical protein